MYTLALEPREIPSIFSLSQFSTPAGGLHKSSCSRRIRGAARGGEGWIEDEEEEEVAATAAAVGRSRTTARWKKKSVSPDTSAIFS